MLIWLPKIFSRQSKNEKNVGFQTSAKQFFFATSSKHIVL